MSDYPISEEDLPLFCPPPRLQPRQLERAIIPVPQGYTFFGTTEENKKKIIEVLQGGIRTCRDIDRLTNSRGQALLGELRSSGHEIQTVCIDGQNCYEYIGRNGSMVKVPKSAQDTYYQTTHWKTTARLRKEVDGWKCCQCGEESQLETHHWVYNLFHEDIETELITLCRQCHGFVHECIKGGACHFPRRIPVETAKRLGWDDLEKKWKPCVAPQFV